MSGPVMGEPFVAYPGPRLSVGDTGASPGTDAWKGVVVLDPTLAPSFNIIQHGGSFNLQVMIRTAVPIYGGFAVPPATSIHFFIHNLYGAAVPGSPFPGTAPAQVPAPGGDHGADGLNDHVLWFSSTTAAPIALADGTYRITVVGHNAPMGEFCYHDGTVVLVGAP